MSEEISLMLILVIYKIACVFAGLLCIYMGYKLFLMDKIEHAGELDAKSGEHKLTLRNAAPGTFFSLFGAFIIALTIIKGVDHTETKTNKHIRPFVENVLPSKPPF